MCYSFVKKTCMLLQAWPALGHYGRKLLGNSQPFAGSWQTYMYLRINSLETSVNDISYQYFGLSSCHHHITHIYSFFREDNTLICEVIQHMSIHVTLLKLDSRSNGSSTLNVLSNSHLRGLFPICTDFLAEYLHFVLIHVPHQQVLTVKENYQHIILHIFPS